MASTSARISPAVHNLVARLARADNLTMQGLMEKAVREFERQRYFEERNAGCARLRADPVEWQAELAERREWDATLADGSGPDEVWSDDGAPASVTG